MSYIHVMDRTKEYSSPSEAWAEFGETFAKRMENEKFSFLWWRRKPELIETKRLEYKKTTFVVICRFTLSKDMPLGVEEDCFPAAPHEESGDEDQVAIRPLLKL